MISLQKREKGFTIVELLIVIVVIGILAALVITTFSGIQRKARDSERQTDINAVHSQIEAYYAQNGRYPTNANLDDDAWVQGNLKGLDLNALKDPKGADNNVGSAAAANVYSYVEDDGSGGACDNDTSTTTADCTKYVLTATLEGGGTYTKNSLN